MSFTSYNRIFYMHRTEYVCALQNEGIHAVEVVQVAQ